MSQLINQFEFPKLSLDLFVGAGAFKKRPSPVLLKNLGSKKVKLKESSLIYVFYYRLSQTLKEIKKSKTKELVEYLKGELLYKNLKIDKKWTIVNTYSCYRLVERYNSYLVKEGLDWFLKNDFWSDKIAGFQLVESKFNYFLLSRSDQEELILSKKEIIK